MKLDIVLLRSRIYEAACAAGVSEQDAITLAHAMSLMAEPLEAMMRLFADERRYRSLSPADVLQAISAFARAGNPATGQVLEVVQGNAKLFRARKAKAGPKRDVFSVAGQLAEAARGKRP